MKLLSLTSAIIFISASALFADTPPATPIPLAPQIQNQTGQTPIDEIFKQNYVDLTNWVKQTAQETGKTVGPLINKAGQTVSEQTPLFINDYIRWQIWSNLFYFIFSLTFVILSIYTLFSNLKKEFLRGREAWEGFNYNQIAVILGGFCTIVSLMGVLPFAVMPYGEAAIKAIIAPRVVIVEKISELIKK